MGITGLIQFIENASKKSNIRNIEGSVVCIDAYCWLHKGVYACSETLAMGGTTDVHIKYCLKYVKMLLHHNVKPILVFDGQHLPAKELTEKKRRESRKQAKTRAAELLRLGKRSEARKYFNRCVDVSHKMAMELMAECRKLNVECIVAPYEADAQLAFFNISGIADYVITEDSDLLLFGCKKILFKLDLIGNCLEVDSSKLHLTMGCSIEKYSFQKFRHMCIISGCDYLESLPGIGLAKACKFILKTEEEDMNRALDKIPSYLNMRHLEVTPEYKLNFLRANATFMHMFVYDTRIRKMVRLMDTSECNTDIELCCNAGVALDDKTAFQLAIGNLDPFSLKKMDNWSPNDKPHRKNLQRFTSIWQNAENSISQSFPSQSSIISNNKIRQLKQRQDAVELNVSIEEENGVSLEEIVAKENDILSLYTNKSLTPSPKRHKPSADEAFDEILLKSPPRRNPFFISRNNTEDTSIQRPLTKTLSPVKRSNSLRHKSKCETLVISRFFNKIDPKVNKTEDNIEHQEREKKIEQNFLQVKMLYESKKSDALSFYLKTDELEKSECINPIEDANKTKCKQPESGEVISDSDDDGKAMKMKFVSSKKSSKDNKSRKTKNSVPTNQPCLTQFMFNKKCAI